MALRPRGVSFNQAADSLISSASIRCAASFVLVQVESLEQLTLPGQQVQQSALVLERASSSSRMSSSRLRLTPVGLARSVLLWNRSQQIDQRCNEGRAGLVRRRLIHARARQVQAWHLVAPRGLHAQLEAAEPADDLLNLTAARAQFIPGRLDEAAQGLAHRVRACDLPAAHFQADALERLWLDARHVLGIQRDLALLRLDHHRQPATSLSLA
jgi:hypothetical protein